MKRQLSNLGLFLLFLSGSLSGQESAFLRFLESGIEWQGQLQTSINSYEDSTGTRVNLVSAIHIADADYYSQLNDFFETQDRVLYELVAEPNQRPVPGATSSGSMLGAFQSLIARILDVEFQLQQIDYTPKNFEHADLSPTELNAIMAAKNESFFTMVMDMAMAQQASSPARGNPSSALAITRLLTALSMENQSQALKYLLAQELGKPESMLVDPELEANLTLLGERNRVALAVLEENLQKPDIQRISLFYGAAHMPGIERSLLNRGFRLTKQTWLTAWAIQ